MPSLNLGTTRFLKQLPASSFPEQADAYVCDTCGRDITMYFRRAHAHVWCPMGPERLTCQCGSRYLTGAIEWDHLGNGERRNRSGQTVGLGIFFSAVASVFAFLFYLLLHFAFGLERAAVITAVVLVALPFVLFQLSFWPSVLASMLRTRLRTRD